MTLTLTRRHLAAGIAVLVVIVGVAVWLALPESCSSWRGRYTQALISSLHGGADERATVRIVAAERPNGCDR